MIWIFFSIIVIIAFTPILLLFIVPFYRKKSHQGEFGELFAILQTVVKSEIELYERDIFENQRGVNNSNFENFYKDLCNRIITRLSPQFMREITYYVTEDMVISMIARTVKEYLVSKIPERL